MYKLCVFASTCGVLISEMTFFCSRCHMCSDAHSAPGIASLVPRPSHHPVFDCLPKRKKKKKNDTYDQELEAGKA